MLDDDDFKISMDDIKDMVSEYFGEKVDKVEAEAARKILKQEMLEFFETGLESVSSAQLTKEEETLLKEYETKQSAPAPVPVVKQTPPDKPAAGGLPDIDEEAFHKNLERQKLEAELKEKIRKELEEEQARKKEATLKKLDDVKKQSAAYQAELTKKQAPAKPGGITLPYTEIMNLLNMFEQCQKVFATILSKLLKRQPVETMFVRTLIKASEKHPEVLKKAGINQGGKQREDGSMEIPRVAANLNALYLPDEKRAEKFFGALREIFEERLIATELATSLEIKDEIISTIMMQIEKIFEKKNYTRKTIDMFVEHIIPNTTMKSGE